MYFVVFRNPSLSFPPIGWITVLLWIYYMFMMKKTYLFCFHFIVDMLHVLQNRSRDSLRHVFPGCGWNRYVPRFVSYKHELWLVACRIKNVPWHILAPVAVACDIYLLRLSAYPRGAFFWFTGNYFPVNQKKFLLRETFFIFTIASPASGYSIPPETIPCTSEYIGLSDQIRFYVLYGTGIWPVSSFHAKMRLYLYSVVIWNPQIETKK